MGLREINATRTKQMIVGVAIELFLERGYEGVTMEDIAHAADIGTSTLYRYFPTKESVIIGMLGDPGMTADALRERPRDEPVEIALGHAIMAFLAFAAADAEGGEKFRQLIEDNPRPRARLTEWFGDMHARLVVAIAERIDAPTPSVQAGAMAWTAIFVLQSATETARDPTESRDVATIALAVMEELALRPPRTPRIKA